MSDLAGTKLPASVAAERLLGSVGGQLITLLSVVSLAPLLNAIMMIGTRILFALGRDRLFWSRTADVNAGGTPGIAMLVTTVAAIVLISVATFQQLVAIASFFLALNYAISCVALVVLRRREPSTPRPFRAWGYPWSAVIVVAGALVFLASTFVDDSATALAAVGVLVVGLAGHAVARGRPHLSKT
jgi:APA family basic amino acid/polyamine antiporter